MNDTSLDLCLRINCLDSFFKTRKPIYTEEENILYPAVFKSLSMPSQNLLVSLAPTVMLSMSL